VNVRREDIIAAAMRPPLIAAGAFSQGRGELPDAVAIEPSLIMR
jgi:hypothetical protein